jgi:16S rRNA (adenine1518-N6/adenine1519-N6)-dimethyltransferase
VTAPARPRARKSLGQHWLVDKRILARIVAALGIQPDDTVVEVGPGTGLLTDFLAPRAARLIAVELDANLAGRLAERYAGAPHVSVINADVLELPPEAILRRGHGRLPYIVTGNLPYFIGSPIIRKFLRAHVQPRSLVVTLQLEVAERMAAPPGRMSYLSVETQVFAQPRVLFRVPPRAFRPPPKVHSAVLRLDLRDSPEVEVDDLDAFLTLAQAGFAAPRKQLRNSLAVGLRLPASEADQIIRAAGIDPSRRPAELDLTAWRDLYFAYRRTSLDAHVDSSARQD